MSITDNMIEVVQKTLVQARGLDKPHRFAILSLVEVTTPDTGNHLSTLGGSKNSSPSTYQDYYPRHQTNSLNTGQTLSTPDNLFCPQASSELGGLCTVQDPQNICGILHDTLRHVSTLYISPTIGAQTLDPQ